MLRRRLGFLLYTLIGGCAWPDWGDLSRNPRVQQAWEDVAGLAQLELRFDSLEIEERATLASSFQSCFGEGGGSGVQNFIRERISLIFPSDIAETEFYLEPSFFRYNFNTSSYQQSGVVTVAENMGTGLFLLSRLNNTIVHVVARGRAFEIHSTRVGLVLLGPSYFDQSLLLRWNTLIHESRHSDCSQPVHSVEFEELRQKKRTELQTKQCGHLHSWCFQVKGLENSLACDDHPWGAYAVSILFLEAVQNFGDPPRSPGKAVLSDLWSRVFIERGQVFSFPMQGHVDTP